MRRVLVDHARRRNMKKRSGSSTPVTLCSIDLDSPTNPCDILVLDEALTRLEKMDPRQARIVELRFFGGFSNEQVSTYLELSVRTVQREWISARAWLFTYIAETESDPEG
jgi:RNA polymerase sigma factor (TIGR02999 family)